MIALSLSTRDVRRLVNVLGINSAELKWRFNQILQREAINTKSRLSKNIQGTPHEGRPFSGGRSLSKVTYTKDISTKFKAGARVGFDSSRLNQDQKYGLYNLLGKVPGSTVLPPHTAQKLAWPAPNAPYEIQHGGIRPSGMMRALEASDLYYMRYTPNAIIGRRKGTPRSNPLRLLFIRADEVSIEHRVDMDHEMKLLSRRVNKAIVRNFPKILNSAPVK